MIGTNLVVYLINIESGILSSLTILWEPGGQVVEHGALKLEFQRSWV